MIAIVDNGSDYSDHAILFIDIGDLPIDVAERVINAIEFNDSDRRDYTVIGAAESIEWRPESETTTIIDYLSGRASWIDDVDEERRVGAVLGLLPSAMGAALLGCIGANVERHAEWSKDRPKLAERVSLERAALARIVAREPPPDDDE